MRNSYVWTWIKIVWSLFFKLQNNKYILFKLFFFNFFFMLILFIIYTIHDMPAIIIKQILIVH